MRRLTSDIYVYDDIKDLDKFCLFLRSFSRDRNEEEKLICEMTRNLYPVYAVGDPNKVLQPNGAERIYVSDDVWQDAVKELSNKSKLILLRIGQTEGTTWEIANIINSKLIKKAIFIAYSQEDYDFFSQMISEKLGVMMPSLTFHQGKPIGLYFIDDDTTLKVEHHEISKKSDVENMLNQYLKVTPELDKEYSLDLDLRRHNLKYMFDKSRIPESVRKSLNWGVVSPVVNMRHWSLLLWLLLAISIVFSVIMRSRIPIIVFILLSFLLGNRIEWAAGGWSSATMFLRHQKREAIFLWMSAIVGHLYSIIYLLLSGLL